MSYRNLGDLVPMPLPDQWGPTVIPPGSQSLPPVPAALLAAVPAGATLGWHRVSGGVILAIRHKNGDVHHYPGASVLPYPGAQVTPPGNAMASDESAAYMSPTIGGAGSPGGNPSAPPNMYPGPNPGALNPVSGLIVHNPTTGRRQNPRDQWGRPKNSPDSLLPPGSTGPAGAWERQPVIPDSMLPPALQRSNPLLGHITYRPNGFDRAISQHSSLWAYIRAHGGLKGCCRIPELGAPVYDDPPWMVQPSQGEKFEEIFAQPISAFIDSGTGDYSGVDVILGQFVVPNGYDGALNRFVCNFTGNGFQDFSGQIFWRLKVNNRFARNLGDVQNTFGDFKTAFSVPGSDNIRLVSQQTITLLANIPPGSPVSDGVVAAGAFGWFYPRR
jgi:hypothetical protein